MLGSSLHDFFFFFFNDTATTEIYTLSLHDALPISPARCRTRAPAGCLSGDRDYRVAPPRPEASFASALDEVRPELPYTIDRSEEHTSELQSRQYLVCRLLLEKKKHNNLVY